MLANRQAHPSAVVCKQVLSLCRLGPHISRASSLVATADARDQSQGLGSASIPVVTLLLFTFRTFAPAFLYSLLPCHCILRRLLTDDILLDNDIFTRAIDCPSGWSSGCGSYVSIYLFGAAGIQMHNNNAMGFHSKPPANHDAVRNAVLLSHGVRKRSEA